MRSHTSIELLHLGLQLLPEGGPHIARFAFLFEPYKHMQAKIYSSGLSLPLQAVAVKLACCGRYMGSRWRAATQKSLSSVLIAAASLSACTIVPQTVSDDYRLPDDQGIALFSVACVGSVGSFSIYPLGARPNGFSDSLGAPAKVQYCRSKPGIRTFALPEGQYFIAVFHSGYDVLILDEEQAHQFSVHANAINYIGEIQILTQFVRKRVQGVSVQVHDQETATVAEAKSFIPDLFNRLSYRKSLAHNVD